MQFIVGEYCVPIHIIHFENSNTSATFLFSELKQNDKMMQKLCRCWERQMDLTIEPRC